MQIAVVCPHLLPAFPHLGVGGTEYRLENLAHGLQAAGLDFFVVCPRRDPELVREYPFPVLEVDCWPTRTASLQAGADGGDYHRRVLELLACERPDLVFLQASEDPARFHTLAARIIVTDNCPCGKRRFEIRDYGNVRYRFVSEAQRRSLVESAEEERLSFMVHTGMAAREYQLETEPGDYYLWVANLNWGFEKKGLDVFLGLAEQLSEKSFVAYGSGNAELEESLRLFERSHANFEFGGQLARGCQHTAAFRGARAFVHVTRVGEAFGRTVLEALTKGTPVLGNSDGGTPEQIDADGGIICDTRDALAASLEALGGFDRRRVFASAQRFHVRHEIEALIRAAGELF